MKRLMTPTGVGTVPLPSLTIAVVRLLERLYWDIPLPGMPITEKHIPKAERNDLICERYRAGETLVDIATIFRLSVQRVHQIIRRWCT
jgi:hypothetical protein